jgi:hypothetical protein
MTKPEIIRGNLSDQVLGNTAVPSEDRPRLRAYALRIVVAISCAMLGFVGACCLLRLLISAPINLYAEIRSEKIALAMQWAGIVSVAAFGSSHVDCGFDPRSFDGAILPAAGHPISLNLGIAGGSQVEQTAVAREYERIVAISPTRRNAHILLMEANSGVNFTGQFMTHPRSINIYDANALLLALQFSDPKLGQVRALGRSLVAMADFGLNFMNVGMLSSQLFRPSLNAALIKTQTQADRRGLSPPPPSPTDARDTRDIHALMATLTSKPRSSPALTTPGLCSEATSLLRDREGPARYTVIFFVTPKLSDLQSYQTYPNAITCGRDAVPIINVALPEAYPELYDPKLWHDISHLNERGAAVYSRLLANAVKGTVDDTLLASL